MKRAVVYSLQKRLFLNCTHNPSSSLRILSPSPKSSWSRWRAAPAAATAWRGLDWTKPQAAIASFKALYSNRRGWRPHCDSAEQFGWGRDPGGERIAHATLNSGAPWKLSL